MTDTPRQGLGDEDEDEELPILEEHEGRILFAPPEDPRVLPATLLWNGIMYRRFMDRILIPSSSDALSGSEIIALNKLRLALVESGHPMTPNKVMKAAVARLISALGATRIVEWGPGVDPIIDHCAVDSYLGVELDPVARALLADRGIPCRSRDDPSVTQYAPADLVVAIFVFHFPVSDADASAMRTLIGESGAITANVYLRDVESRRHLVGIFERLGLTCAIAADLSGLCREHELWVIARDPGPRLAAFQRIYREVVATFSKTPD